ncbi:alpha/beta fold hydrolase [Janthinobacterium agaricidamnosum]|uniref:Signal peptide protein n=1 Tax=Janthinobacterium agaricidamnosum NBRC 102515 = DSM 9628 TaxID=1349767 RepID=W0VF22_9BURK|nr:alpha/beta hydrolase [Janthinobacterium agaricidamnosum]CDG85932.1 signal peptide protein [Janthinobacterium agaricidamnosum NBRC 102515 = DSM 9628]
MKRTYAVIASAIACAAFTSGAGAQERIRPPGARNVIIVHDAFVDGSGWRAVHDILYQKGYNVSVVQNTLHSLQEDAVALDKQLMYADGPAVLVGHGYGGSVITIGGSNKKVKALVYVAGYAPDVSESVSQLANSMPPANDSLRTTFDGFVFINPAYFGRDYAADLPETSSAYMAVSQQHATTTALGGQSRTVAWRGTPSYGIVASDDRIVKPELQRWMYQRAGSKVTEIKASHALYISQPEAVAKVIEEAALAAK